MMRGWLLGMGMLLAAVPAAAAASTAHARLFALFHASDEAALRRDPLEGVYRGDLRFAGRLGDYFTDAYADAELTAARADLAALGRIDRAALDPTDRIAYDVFAYRTRLAIRRFSDPAIRTVAAVQPIDHFSGFHLDYADLASGEGAAPFRSLADYRQNLARDRDYPRLIDQIIARFRQGMGLGIVESRLTVRRMVEQLDLQIAQGVEGSTFYKPVLHMPATIPASDQAQLRTDYAAAVRDGIRPALVRLRGFLRDTYLPAAREGVGLVAMKGGPAYYAWRIEQQTTEPLTAQAVHQLGLSEVARIRADMEAGARAAGFTGTLPELFTYMRTAKQFQPGSATALRDGFSAIRMRVEARIGEQFSTLPRTPLEIRPTPDFKARTAAGGEYMQGSADGSRPGVFYYNTYDLPARYTWEMETLFLHEAEPGHHFQISLAQENKALPNFLRFGGNTAFVEGWALYAESLWKPLGMESDPWQRLGGLNDEMLRAMRLVVDSGIHAYGWSREQAIRYMLDNSPESETDATAEVERYIANPGQALAYKVGELTIQRLKRQAQAALGARFDPRAFHAQVLMTGALPMPVLERKIGDWIATRRKIAS